MIAIVCLILILLYVYTNRSVYYWIAMILGILSGHFVACVGGCLLGLIINKVNEDNQKGGE